MRSLIKAAALLVQIALLAGCMQEVTDSRLVGEGQLADCRYLGDGVYYNRFELPDGTESSRQVFNVEDSEGRGQVPKALQESEVAAADEYPWDERSVAVLVSGGAEPEIAIEHVDHIDDPAEMAEAQEAVERRAAEMPSCMP